MVTGRMAEAALREGVEPETIRRGLADGSAVISANTARLHVPPMAVGRGLRVKVNANLGTSPRRTDLALELAKLDAAVEAGADAVMDLSTGGDLAAVRAAVLERCPVAVGTVPVYQAVADLARAGRSLGEMTDDDLFGAVERHVEEGVDFITVHCGVTRRSLERLEASPRVLGVVSRGGALLAEWMRLTGRENPLYREFDRLLAIARARDAILSLGDGLRPGCLADATDAAQVEELATLGELTRRAWAAGVQVMVEGPGHIPLHQIETNVRLQKALCHGAPFYVLGPLPTDIAAGRDHITSAIGGAIAALHGADFLCYVTPAEHLRLPDVDDVREGVMASRIAAHAADLARGLPGAWERDLAMSRCRGALDWEGQKGQALDPEAYTRLQAHGDLAGGEGCTMCGDFCPFRLPGNRPPPA
jgi:phosphomethylpyrimidine synthase